MTQSYSSPLYTPTFSRRGKPLSSFLLFLLLLLTTLTCAFSGSQQARADDNKGFDLVKWVACNTHPLLKQFYQLNTTDEARFELDSKSSITTGQEDVTTGLNWILSATGSNFTKVNEDVLGRPINGSASTDKAEAGSGTPSTTPAAGSAKATPFNGGSTKYNPFDRFGMAGLYWTSYKGEWKYVIVDACGDKDPVDPKTGLYYEKRLVPRATYQQVDNSRDPRSEPVKRGLIGNTALAFMNVFANLVFWCAKLVVTLAIAFINVSFVDIVGLLKIDVLLAGKDGSTGMFSVLFQSLFLPFTVIAFAATAFYIIYWAIIKGEARKSLIALGRSLFMFFFAFWAAANPALFMMLPNKLAVGFQALVVSSMNKSLAGGSGLCSTTMGGAPNKEVALASGKVKEGKEQDFLSQASANMKSSISCTLWQQLLLRPWAQGQFGEGWEKTWAKGKIPSWAPTNNSSNSAYNHAAFANGDENARMVGTADVPLGNKTVVNNWAIFQISTQTNVHAPYGKNNERPKVTNGVANDWWRIVDVLTNYEEQVVDPTTYAGTAKGPFSEEKMKEENTTDKDSAPPLATPTPGQAHVNPLKTMVMVPTYAGHSGIDYKASEGTPAFAADSGTVVRAGGASGQTAYGVAVIIKNAAGEQLVYGHLTAGSPTVKEGDTVKAGQQIGLTGNTSGVTRPNSGPHLHFEVVPPGGKTGVSSNRDYTVKWIQGATNNGQTEGGTAQGDATQQQQTEYLESKGNAPLTPWNTWNGSSSGGRIAVAFSSLFIAFVGVIGPLVFAFLCSFYALGVAIVMAFAPVMLLFGCWAGKGWEIFKGWGELVVNLTLRRMIAGLLLVFVILLNDAALHVVELVSWWQGVVMLALIAYLMVSSRHKIFDTIATLHFSSVNFRQGYDKISKKSQGAIKQGGRLSTTPLIGGASSRKNGGTFTAGAKSGLYGELRHLSYRNSTMRAIMRSYDEASIARRGLSAHANPDALTCVSCDKPHRQGDTVYITQEGGYLCEECAEMSGASATLPMLNINWTKTEADLQEEEAAAQGGMDRVTLHADASAKDTQEQLLSVAKADKNNDDDFKTRGDAFVNLAYSTIENDISLHKEAAHMAKTKNLEKVVTFDVKIPSHLKPYLDYNLMQLAWDNKSYDYVRQMHALAWGQWAKDNMEVPFVNAVEDLVEEIMMLQLNALDDDSVSEFSEEEWEKFLKAQVASHQGAGGKAFLNSYRVKREEKEDTLP